MTKHFSVAFKQKMVHRLTGKNAVSAKQLSRETGVRQQNLSRWLQEARSLPFVTDKPKPVVREWTVEQKARLLAEAAKFDGEQLSAYLEREGVKLPEYERWRIALAEDGASASSNKRIRELERELARKEKALAETAALLVLKKKVDAIYGADEDDDTNGENEK